LYYELFEIGKITKLLIKKTAKYGKDIPLFFEQKKCTILSHFGEKTTPLSLNFSKQKLFIYLPPFKYATKDAYKKLSNYNTSFTKNFLKNPNFKNCGNAFDEFLKNSKYKKIIKNPNDLHITGSGSCLWTINEKNFLNCPKIKTNFL
jgi:4-diphosphocytidyl-2C-methyl-D-erythritol kinase